MAFSNGYSYRKALTVDHTKVSGSADLSSFPMLVSLTDAALATVANGGKVQSASGFDVRFELADGTKLDHEVEAWSATTGKLIAWVRIPTLSVSVDSMFYVYYGNASVAATEENATGVWDADHKAVWHLSKNGALSLADSTANANTLTNVGSAPATAAEVDSGVSLNGTSQYLQAANDFNTLIACTVEGWVKCTGSAAYQTMLGSGSSRGGGGFDWFIIGRNNGQWVVQVGTGNTAGSATFIGTGTLPAAGLHHVVGTYSGTDASGTLRLFIDGVQVATSPVSGRTSASHFTSHFLIGAGENSSLGKQEYLQGAVDEARVSDIARSADWIATTYAAVSSPATFYAVGTEDSGSASTTASGTLTEAGESASGSATAAAAASGTGTEAGESIAGSSSSSVTGSGTVGEAGESVGSTTTSVDNTSGGASEAAESLGGTATVSENASGTATQAGESLSGFTGAAPDQASGSITQAGESLGGASSSSASASGTTGETESLSGTASASDTSIGAATQAGEKASGSATVTDAATGALGEAGESMQGTATSTMPGTPQRVRVTTLVRSRYAVTTIIRSRYRVNSLIS